MVEIVTLEVNIPARLYAMMSNNTLLRVNFQYIWYPSNIERHLCISLHKHDTWLHSRPSWLANARAQQTLVPKQRQLPTRKCGEKYDKANPKIFLSSCPGTMDASEGLPRIVIVDHYDSYTRNLISLIASCFDPLPSPELLASRVVVIPQSSPALAPENFQKHLPHVDALILSPLSLIHISEPTRPY